MIEEDVDAAKLLAHVLRYVADGPGFAASESLQAVPTSSIAQTPATARPCFRTELLNT